MIMTIEGQTVFLTQSWRAEAWQSYVRSVIETLSYSKPNGHNLGITYVMFGRSGNTWYVGHAKNERASNSTQVNPGPVRRFQEHATCIWKPNDFRGESWQEIKRYRTRRNEEPCKVFFLPIWIGPMERVNNEEIASIQRLTTPARSDKKPRNNRM